MTLMQFGGWEFDKNTNILKIKKKTAIFSHFFQKWLIVLKVFEVNFWGLKYKLKAIRGTDIKDVMANFSVWSNFCKKASYLEKPEIVEW